MRPVRGKQCGKYEKPDNLALNCREQSTSQPTESLGETSEKVSNIQLVNLKYVQFECLPSINIGSKRQCETPLTLFQGNHGYRYLMSSTKVYILQNERH